MTKSGPNDISEPLAISRLLANVIENKQWRLKLDLHRVFEFWPEIVGPEIAAIAQPSLIRGHVLWVKVSESIWMQQLHLQKMLLLEKINNRLHEEQFSDIHFQLNSSLSPQSDPPPGKLKPALLDKKEEQEFDRLISSLENEDLRASLKSLWITMKTKGR